MAREVFYSVQENLKLNHPLDLLSFGKRQPKVRKH